MKSTKSMSLCNIRNDIQLGLNNAKDKDFVMVAKSRLVAWRDSFDGMIDQCPVAYMILRSDGEVHWDEVDCIHRNYGAALEVVATMNEDGDGFTYRVLRLHGDTRAFA